ncbi:putative CD276 antigen-like [Triplophysa rosa]|uniref:CD276 antigen-like n=1 Tax=Triplophysa rosa TaxID=992332 RepID=A0A9W7T2Y1_TRIRA|nr:putative CD276 antigen-like [Triplophysa rosa]
MIVGCLIYLFAVLLNKVSLEVSVTGYVGDPAVLPCSYTEDKNKVQEVSWKYDHKKIVYEFSPESPQSNMDSERFESFRDEYDSGNYSIKIKKLVITDKGVYTCIITPADYVANIKLIIKEQTKIQDPSSKGHYPFPMLLDWL